MAKLFEKQRTNFYYNWLSFIEDFLKSFLVCFLMGHSVHLNFDSMHLQKEQVPEAANHKLEVG